jgi:hypothetical protein
MKYIITFFLLSITFDSSAQHEADTWYFGFNAGITFSTTPPSVLPGGQIVTPEGCASLSDNNGNLLFYSDGATIWSANHMVMPNGTGLNGSLTCSQSALIVPYPGNGSLYYIFTPPDEFTNTAFCYSIVDMTLNNNMGDVTNKNTPLFIPSTEKVTAVRHANGVDIWVIGHSFNNSDFYSYLLTPAGINTTPVISSAGTMNGGGIGTKIGNLKASPCGDKLALTVLDSAFAEVFDFDNSTGVVSNAIHLGNFLITAWGLYGVEFSPGGSRLYVTQENPALLLQYDLLAGSPAAIIASADTISFVTNSWTKYAGLQNGPDGKMYMSRFTETFLACINNPDSLGATCNYVDNAVSLGTATATHGLPNFMSSYFCDRKTSLEEEGTLAKSLSVYPVPAHDKIHISFKKHSENYSITISDLLGKINYQEKVQEKNYGYKDIEISVANYPAGIYWMIISCNNETAVNKFVKQ